MNRRQFIVSGLAAGSYLTMAHSRLNSIAVQPHQPRVGTAIIGLGDRGLRRLSECIAHPSVDIKGICDISSISLAHASSILKQKHSLDSAQITRDIGAILKDRKIQNVSIAVPIAARPKLIAAAAKEGKRILVEPLWASSIAESESVFKTIERYGAIVHQASHDSDWDEQYIQQVLNSAQKGLTTVHLNVEVGKGGADSPTDLLFHGFDILRSITQWMQMDEVASVSGLGGSPVNPIRRSVAIRLTSRGDESKHLLMSVSESDLLDRHQLEAHVESRDKNGRSFTFTIRSVNPEEGTFDPDTTSIGRFLRAATNPTESGKRSRQTYELNRSWLLAAAAVEKSGLGS